MSKELVIKCDRCQNKISTFNERILDIIEKEYFGKDICPDCDLEIELARSCAKKDIQDNLSPGTTLKKMAICYGIMIE